MTNVINNGGRTSISTHKELETTIERLAADTRAPDGTQQRTLSVDHTLQVTRQFGVSTKTVELTALEIEILPLRYQRNQKTLNLIELKQLLNSKAVIVGLGGLGGTVTEILARANVGHLVLVDGDRFEDHNLNRQLLCTQDRLGASKAMAAADRVAAVNSAIEVVGWRSSPAVRWWWIVWIIYQTASCCRRQPGRPASCWYPPQLPACAAR